MPRLTKIYTRKGDEGYTSLGEEQLSKDDLLVEAVGNIDELNSCIGMIIAFGTKDKEIEDCLTQIQQDLFDFGGELHVPDRMVITEDKVKQLETQLDNWNKALPTLKEFILPRGNPASAACHVARAVCRRTERSLVRLHRQVTLHNPQMLCYLNRLSDLLFVTARMLAKTSDEKELMWENNK